MEEGQVGVDAGDGGAQVGDGFGWVAGGSDEDGVGEAVLIFFGWRRFGVATGCGRIDGAKGSIWARGM